MVFLGGLNLRPLRVLPQREQAGIDNSNIHFARLTIIKKHGFVDFNDRIVLRQVKQGQYVGIGEIERR